MATAYVSTAGSDSTGDGSAESPWKTIGKAIGSGAAFTLDPAAPNALYIEPGVYRESVTLEVSPTLAGVLTIQRDPAKAGLVDWRAWSDDHTPIVGECLAVVGAGNVAVRNVKFVAGDASNGAVYFAGGSNYTVADCAFISGYAANQGRCVCVQSTAGAALGLTIERCAFSTLWGATSSGAVYIRDAIHTADYDLDAVVRNCWFDGRNCGLYVFQPGGTGTVPGGGIAFQSNTVRSAYLGVYGFSGATGVPAKPILVDGCLFLGCGLRAAVSGQVVEDGNVILADTQRTLVAAGANSITAACPALNLGDVAATGDVAPAYGAPATAGPLHGFGDYGTVPADDAYGFPRPSPASVGAVEADVWPTGGGGGGGGGGSTVVNLGASMGYKGDISRGQSIELPFETSATLSGGTAAVVRQGDGAKSTAGVTVSVDVGAITGCNDVTVDTAADAAFYENGRDYRVWLTAGTSDGDSAVGLIGSFSIRNRPDPVMSPALDTSDVKGAGG